jgi:hypothetical protein
MNPWFSLCRGKNIEMDWIDPRPWSEIGFIGGRRAMPPPHRSHGDRKLANAARSKSRAESMATTGSTPST